MKYYGIFMITGKGKKISDFFTLPEGERVGTCVKHVIKSHNKRLQEDRIHKVIYRPIEKLDADLILCTWQEREAEALAIEANILTREEILAL